MENKYPHWWACIDAAHLFWAEFCAQHGDGQINRTLKPQTHLGDVWMPEWKCWPFLVGNSLPYLMKLQLQRKMCSQLDSENNSILIRCQLFRCQPPTLDPVTANPHEGAYPWMAWPLTPLTNRQEKEISGRPAKGYVTCPFSKGLWWFKQGTEMLSSERLQRWKNDDLKCWRPSSF